MAGNGGFGNVTEEPIAPNLRHDYLTPNRAHVLVQFIYQNRVYTCRPATTTVWCVDTVVCTLAAYQRQRKHDIEMHVRCFMAGGG